MLSKLGEEVRDCLERAAECRRKADAATVPSVRESYFEMAERWLRLADSYELLGRLRTFADNARRH